MKLTDKFKAIFAKAQDEAMKVVDEAAKEEEKKESKDAEASGEKKDDKKEEKAKDAPAYDELMKLVKDLGEKISAMAQPKDASTKADGPNPAEIEAKDDESPAEKSMEDRMKALEMAVAKLLEGKASDADESEEGEEESAEDESGYEEEESEDDDFEESSMTGDTASRIEILAPGMKAEGKDAKAKALLAAYNTVDGKATIDKLTGGKAPDVKDEAIVDTMFVAVSELLKHSRTADLSQTKQTRDFSSGDNAPTAMTAEKMNEINAKHYGKK
jgi:hypothetical protein